MASEQETAAWTKLEDIIREVETLSVTTKYLTCAIEPTALPPHATPSVPSPVASPQDAAASGEIGIWDVYFMDQKLDDLDNVISNLHQRHAGRAGQMQHLDEGCRWVEREGARLIRNAEIVLLEFRVAQMASWSLKILSFNEEEMKFQATESRRQDGGAGMAALRSCIIAVLAVALITPFVVWLITLHQSTENTYGSELMKATAMVPPPNVAYQKPTNCEDADDTELAKLRKELAAIRGELERQIKLNKVTNMLLKGLQESKTIHLDAPQGTRTTIRFTEGWQEGGTVHEIPTQAGSRSDVLRVAPQTDDLDDLGESSERVDSTVEAIRLQPEVFSSSRNLVDATANTPPDAEPSIPERAPEYSLGCPDPNVNDTDQLGANEDTLREATDHGLASPRTYRSQASQTSLAGNSLRQNATNMSRKLTASFVYTAARVCSDLQNFFPQLHRLKTELLQINIYIYFAADFCSSLSGELRVAGDEHSSRYDFSIYLNMTYGIYWLCAICTDRIALLVKYARAYGAQHHISTFKTLPLLSGLACVVVLSEHIVLLRMNIEHIRRRLFFDVGYFRPVYVLAYHGVISWMLWRGTASTLVGLQTLVNSWQLAWTAPRWLLEEAIQSTLIIVFVGYVKLAWVWHAVSWFNIATVVLKKARGKQTLTAGDYVTLGVMMTFVLAMRTFRLPYLECASYGGVPGVDGAYLRSLIQETPSGEGDIMMDIDRLAIYSMHYTGTRGGRIRSWGLVSIQYSESSWVYSMGIDTVYRPRFTSAAAFGSGEFVHRAVGKHPTTSEPPASVCDPRTLPPVASKSAEQDIKYTRDTGGGVRSLDTTRDVVISRGITYQAAGSTRRGGGNTARRSVTKLPPGRTWYLKAA
ncbi:hypothetical protein OF83DRAFT_1088329 [Amylostereum chailletii]|nr:hypothetical protein OF83DRAFT_1088329 [Amylostereum chailletii]